ncbi:unnamed protein product [Penicillium bialowiezense]
MLRKGFPQERLNPRLLSPDLGHTEHCFHCVLRAAFRARFTFGTPTCSGANRWRRSCQSCIPHDTACFRIPLRHSRLLIHAAWTHTPTRQFRARKAICPESGELCRDVARAHAVTKEDYRNISRSRAAHGTQHQLDNVVLLEHSDNVSDSDQSVVPYSTPNFPVYL